jgi:hypothetical protein
MNRLSLKAEEMAVASGLRSEHFDETTFGHDYA